MIVHRRPLLLLALLGTVGCFDSFAIEDAPAFDAGRDAGRDLGSPDFGTDFGRPDLGAPDLGLDAGEPMDGGVEVFADGSVVIGPRPPIPNLYEACNAIEVLHCLGTHLCCDEDPSGRYGTDASFCEAERLARDGVGSACEIFRDRRATDGTIRYDEETATDVWEDMRDRLRICAQSPVGYFPDDRFLFIEGTLPVGADCAGGDPAIDDLSCERALRCNAGVCATRAASGDRCESHLDCGTNLVCNTANPSGEPRCDAVPFVGRTRSWCVRD